MLWPVRAALLIAGLLLFASPASAQTVGEGNVITDQASETESDVPYADDGQPAPEPEPDASGRRGEIHVLDAAASASSSPAATPSPAAVHRPATLPFTGIDAAPLALIGLALLASGWALRLLSLRGPRTRPYRR
ncbi:MAG: hypothetical protein QOH46_2764 [Solirubrobacteraceae bacterium]|nr:hypothetical protein [Solirubrobacteraceae bacterium]